MERYVDILGPLSVGQVASSVSVFMCWCSMRSWCCSHFLFCLSCLFLFRCSCAVFSYALLFGYVRLPGKGSVFGAQVFRLQALIFSEMCTKIVKLDPWWFASNSLQCTPCYWQNDLLRHSYPKGSLSGSHT